MNRYFVEEGQDADQTVKWKVTDAVITGVDGNEIFRQDNVEFPSTWSQTAINIAASKYFCKSEEHGVHSWGEVVNRVCAVIADTTCADLEATSINRSILYDELAYILLHQMACFNTPVMVNLSNPDYENQVSACFVLDVEDSLDDILQQAVLMGKIFTHGSGAGIDLSTLRGEGEAISGGGTSSGVVSWAKIYDAVNASIKAGKIRRAASLYNLDIYHPDIEQFINIKAEEENLIEALIEAGYDGNMDGTATQHGWLQNANLSVRVDDKFMQAVVNNDDIVTSNVGTGDVHTVYNARYLLEQIAKGVWRCGDPGLIYLGNIAKWATVKPTHIGLNPCCEFISYSGTGACNLASINLIKFIEYDKTTETFSFDVQAFGHVVDVLITAMDLLVDIGVYPTEEIEQAAKKYRPLGLGYSNLGAMLMYLGLPYDSDEGRAVAALVTALLTGRAYRRSAELARQIGSCEGLDSDRQDKIVNLHHKQVADIDVGIDNKMIGNMVQNTKSAICANFVDIYASTHGFRNTAVTCLMPGGTTGLVMDCESTGIEPLFSLGSTKTFSGGGQMQYGSSAVSSTLKRLGYSDNIDNVQLSAEDKHIFDTALDIAPAGHLDMVVAVQPFVSQGISKTINCPNDTTPEQIAQLYIDTWKKGIKSISVYRDGSKSMQPIKQKEDKSVAVQADSTLRPLRTRLPVTRDAITHRFEVAGTKGYITAGLYDDGRPGELFLRVAKEGSTLAGLLDSFAVAVSLGLQHGVPLESYIRKYKHMTFEPKGFTKNEDIRTASSIVDYIASWLESTFLSQKVVPKADSYSTSEENTYADVLCRHCGKMMVRSGTCYYCDECGENTGCA